MHDKSYCNFDESWNRATMTGQVMGLMQENISNQIQIKSELPIGLETDCRRI